MTSPGFDSRKFQFLLKPKHIALVVSLLASIFLIVSALMTYRSYQSILRQSLTIQAYGMEAFLQSLVRNFDLHFLKLKRNFLTDLIISENWQGVSYIALYSKEGIILLHSNPEQIGKRIEPLSLPVNGSKSYYFTQNPEDELFIYENKVRLEDQTVFLRIALYISPVRETLGLARVHLLFDFILASLILLLGLGSFLILNRLEKETKKVEELRNWQIMTQILLHEIKNPLATIKGFTQYLLSRTDDNRLKTPLEYTLREAIRIERLLKDLSMFSFPQNPVLSETNLMDLLTEIKSNLEFIYPQIKIKLDLSEANIQIATDPHLLKSILYNLLDNAISATTEAGESEVYVKVHEIENGIAIEILDRGVGIPDEIKNKIFEPFFTTKSKGTGLGLAIVKKLCDTLGLKVTVEKAIPKGTRALLEIPKNLLI